MKKLMLITAPVTSRSGYGDHSRDLVHSFLDIGKFDVKIMDVPWGSCPRTALNENNEKNQRILNCILSNPQLNRQPDVYVDIRIPNEFETYGKFNIGITAGVETSAVSNSWIESCNKMDLVIVPSKHSKDGFVNSVYDKLQNLPDGKQQRIGELKLEKPMEVLFEGVDENVYKPLSKDEIDSEFFDWLNAEVPEKFAFLHVGQWTKGNMGEDRKDIATLVKLFYQTFANMEKQPALILKTSGAGFSILDREECLTKLKTIKSMFPSDANLPNVYLLHGDLSTTELNYLYNHPKTKCMISLTHGEGFGRPLLEASMVGLPIITSNWSGHIDFIDSDNALLLPGKLEQIPKGAAWKDIVIPESQWFNVDQDAVYKAMRFVFDKHDSVKNRASDLMNKNRNRFTHKGMTDELNVILDKFLKDAPTQVSLKLPELKKVSSDKSSNKIKLPKLKKVTEV